MCVWAQVAEAPADLMDRRVEITGPVDRKMVRKRSTDRTGLPSTSGVTIHFRLTLFSRGFVLLVVGYRYFRDRMNQYTFSPAAGDQRPQQRG